MSHQDGSSVYQAIIDVSDYRWSQNKIYYVYITAVDRLLNTNVSRTTGEFLAYDRIAAGAYVDQMAAVSYREDSGQFQSYTPMDSIAGY